MPYTIPQMEEPLDDPNRWNAPEPNWSTLRKMIDREKTEAFLAVLKPGERHSKRLKRPHFLKRGRYVKKKRLLSLRMHKQLLRQSRIKFKEEFHPKMMLHPGEIALLIDQSQRTAYRVIDEIRKLVDKPKRVPITVADFCKYYHCSEEEVYKRLGK